MFVCAGAVLGGCGDDGGRTSDGGAATQATTTTDGPLTTTGGATDEPTTTSPTGTAGETMTGTADATTTDATTGTVSTDTSTTDSGVNNPPVWESEPTPEIVIEELYKRNFAPGQIFLASSRTDEIRVYDANSLAFIQAFTHPVFSEVDSPLFTYGPNGASFNSRGNLVVAGYSSFVEFSDYGVEYAVYPKIASEATENVIFDPRGNLYTTTATGGTDKLNKYDAEDYAFEQQIPLPAGAGQLTGITFDGQGRLYLASQTDNTIHVADFADFDSFPWIDTLSGAGNPGNFEGLQFNANGELVAAAGDLVRYDVDTGDKLGTFDQPNDAFPVPLRVDNEGNIYTADYENGQAPCPPTSSSSPLTASR
jgi:WD40 repeat protein